MSLYGCHNKPRPVTDAPVIAQDGYHEGWTPQYCTLRRMPNWITVPYVMSTECQYTKQHAADPHCAGCGHRAKEEA